MRKTVFLLMLAILLCFPVGCDGADTAQALVYVGYVDARGFVGELEGVGFVFFCYEDADERVSLFDTVRVTYRPSALAEWGGEVTAITGNPMTYTRTLTDVIRVNVEEGRSVLG